MLDFSVVIPTHNRVESLRRLIESLLKQTVAPSQIIVINDNADTLPPDISASVKQASIDYIEKNIGAGSAPTARNEGLKLAGGDIIVLVDDDVELYDDTLERFYQIYTLDTIGAVGCVGAVVIESQVKNRLANRLWWFLAGFFGQNAWRTRKNIARYAPLSAPLKKMIVPARKISGSLFTMRRKAARAFQFDEAMNRVKGYTLGDDREFGTRLCGAVPVFTAENIKALHHSHPQGRPGSFQIGKMKLPSLKYISRKSGQTQAGSRVVIWYEISGMMLLHFFWGIINHRRRNLYIAGGIFASIFYNANICLKSVWYGGKADE